MVATSPVHYHFNLSFRRLLVSTDYLVMDLREGFAINGAVCATIRDFDDNG
jgi:hypothetical protein